MGLFLALKKNAKLAMRGHWIGGMLILLIQIGANGVINVLQQAAVGMFVLGPAVDRVPYYAENQSEYTQILSDVIVNSTAEWAIIGAAALLQLLLIFPLSLGVIRWYFRIVHGGNPSITEAFYFFETPKAYLRAVWYDISIGIRTTLWAVLFYALPSAVMLTSVYFLSAEDDSLRLERMAASAGVVFSVLMFLAATVFFCAFVNRYALVAYLVGADDEITVGKAIKMSIQYTKGYRFRILLFSLSFIGWFLLCVFFIPLFFVVPYYMAAYALYARYIIDNGGGHSFMNH
ncbi:MAG: DUF975 family protein [Oscillospiraceae bacterium]|nr:DUF975 family protein [Oscillospiraceae bacterium]